MPDHRLPTSMESPATETSAIGAASSASAHAGSPLEVLLAFLGLGLTSFGGPRESWVRTADVARALCCSPRPVATERAVRRELADLQQLLGGTTPETFVHFEGEPPRNCDPNGTRKLPIAGDLVIFFRSLESP